MCIGESSGDTLDIAERDFLRAAAATAFPDHSFSVLNNEDGIHWVVLEPAVLGPATLRVTICRIDPCVMVMMEDEASRRQICSASTVEDAFGFARLASDQALLAAMNAHPAPATLQ